MGVSRSPHRAGDYFPVWNAKSYADRRGDGCPSAPAMQHSGAGHGTVSSVVSHDPLRSKHKSGSVGVVDQTVAPGARQRRLQRDQTACSESREPASSKRRDYCSPAGGGVDLVAGAAAEFEESEHSDQAEPDCCIHEGAAVSRDAMDPSSAAALG
jgi:hypothetical protein